MIGLGSDKNVTNISFFFPGVLRVYAHVAKSDTFDLEEIHKIRETDIYFLRVALTMLVKYET